MIRARRALVLGGVVLLLLWGVLDSSSLPRTAFFGGSRLAEKWAGLELQERAGPLDVLALGASQIDQGFDAQRFGEASGLRAYNLGVAGTDVYLQSILARTLLLTGRRPRILLWGSLDRTQWHTRINLQYLNAPAATLAQGPFARQAFELGRHLPQFQRRRVLDWGELALGERAAADDAERVDAFGRVHVPARREKTAEPLEASELSEALEHRKALDYGVDLAGVRAHVEETLRLLRAAGVQIWFVLTPYEQSQFERDSAHAIRVLLGPPDGHYEWLQRIAPRYDLELVDLHYCREFSSDPALFHDSTHLNGEGSLRLGTLLGELVAGRRPLPPEWRGFPAQAELDAIFGHEPPADPAALEPGEAYRLTETSAFFPTGSPTDVYARVEIAQEGAYRLAFGTPGALEAIGAFFVRIGDGNFRTWRAQAPRRQRALEWRLTPGTHVLELHTLAGQTVDWGSLTLERVPDDGPRATPPR